MAKLRTTPRRQAEARFMQRHGDTFFGESAMKRFVLCLTTVLLLAGALPAQSEVIYRASLSGLNEEPPNDAPGHGGAAIIIDDVEHSMAVTIAWSNMASATTAAHIHCCTVDPLTGTAIPATMVPSFPGFPMNAAFDGLYEATFSLLDPATYNPAFISANGGTVAGAEAAFLAGLASGRSYVNIHTELFPNGHIRGFLTLPQTGGTIPEPGSAALLGLGAAGLALFRRRRSSRAMTTGRAEYGSVHGSPSPV
jgi:hypothetical protein